MIRRILFTGLALAFTVASFLPRIAQAGDVFVTASSINGGYAQARGVGIGNALVTSQAVANRGIARSNAYGRGIYGGFANVNSAAFSQGGIANSTAVGDAQYGASVLSNSTAATRGGIANSYSNGFGIGAANVQSYSTANSLYGIANSQSHGAGYGLYGPANVTSDSYSHAGFGGRANSSVFANGVNGSAHAQGRSFDYGYGY